MCQHSSTPNAATTNQGIKALDDNLSTTTHRNNILKQPQVKIKKKKFTHSF
jgi:hypothetical protein